MDSGRTVTQDTSEQRHTPLVELSGTRFGK